MSYAKMLLLGLIVIGLSGCNHWNKHPHYGDDFCPPGQAKKGNC